MAALFQPSTKTSGIDFRTMDPSLQLEVDIMILDNLVHTAILALLDEGSQKEKIQKSDQALHAMSDFLDIFNSKHSDVDAPNARVRLQILQLITMMQAYRSASVRQPTRVSAANFRHQNKSRADRLWHEDESAAIDRLFKDVSLLGSPQSQSCGPHHEATVLDVMDMLPMFMALSVQVTETIPSPEWMDLALDFMAQATVRTSLFWDCVRASAVRQAFVWAASRPSPDDPLEQAVHDMIWHEDDPGREAATMWIKKRDALLLQLNIPDPTGELETFSSTDSTTHYKVNRERIASLKAASPKGRWRKGVYRFLDDLVAALEPPILAQLDAGQVIGLTREETDDLKRRCGIIPRDPTG